MKHLIALALFLAAFFWLDPLIPRYAPFWMGMLTKLGNTTFLILVWLSTMSYCLLKKREQWFSISYELLAHLALGIVIAYILKVSIGRVRPLYVEDIAFVPFTLKVINHSTPSSHAIAAFIVAYSLPYRKWLIPLATLVALSRVFLHKHYLSDVVLGIWIATLVIDYGYRYKPLLTLKNWIKKTGRKIPTGLKDS